MRKDEMKIFFKDHIEYINLSKYNRAVFNHDGKSVELYYGMNSIFFDENSIPEWNIFRANLLNQLKKWD